MIKKKFLGFLLFLSVLSMLCSCEEQNDKKGKIETMISKDKEASTEKVDTDKVSFEEHFKTVEVDNKKTGFPFSLEDLGEGYDIQSQSMSSGIIEGISEGELVLSNQKKMNIQVKEKKFEDVTQKSQIIYIETFEDNVSISGIKVGDTTEKLKKIMDVSDEIVNKSDGEEWNYFADDGTMTFFIKENTIAEISMEKYFNELSINFNEICKKISLQGQKIEFPFSLQDLGNGYQYDRDIMLQNYIEGCCSTVLILPNENILPVDVMSNEYIGINDSSKIMYISSTSVDDEFSIGKVSVGSKKETVIKELGSPTKIINNGKNFTYIYQDARGIIEIVLNDKEVKIINIRQYNIK